MVSVWKIAYVVARSAARRRKQSASDETISRLENKKYSDTLIADAEKVDSLHSRKSRAAGTNRGSLKEEKRNHLAILNVAHRP